MFKEIFQVSILFIFAASVLARGKGRKTNKIIRLPICPFSQIFWTAFLSSSLKRSCIRSFFYSVTKLEWKAATPAGKARAKSPAEKGSQSKSATSCCNDCAKTSCLSEEIEAVPAERVCLKRNSTAYTCIDVPRGLFQRPRGTSEGAFYVGLIILERGLNFHAFHAFAANNPINK